MSNVIESIILNPQDIFLDKIKQEDILNFTKNLLDPIASDYSILDEIHVNGLDATQVWAQAKIILDSASNEILLNNLAKLKSKIKKERSVKRNDVESKIQSDDDEESSDDDNEDDEDSEEEDSDDKEENEEESDVEMEENSESEEGSKLKDDANEEEESVDEHTSEKKSDDKFGLDDGFFSLEEFNRQTLLAERNGFDEEDDDEEEVDMFGEISADEDLHHKDFFDTKNYTNKKSKGNVGSKRKHDEIDNKEEEEEEEEEEFGEEDYDEGINNAKKDIFAEFDDDDEEEEEGEDSKLSKFEKQQKLISEQIRELELENIGEKKWTLKGEAQAKQRPHNSLLQVQLDFEGTSKPVPVITAELIETIEEIIKKRILNDQFDELEKRLPNLINFKPSKDFTTQLQDTKSSKSLAEIYEDDFKNDSMNSTSTSNLELEKAHDEIKQIFNSLTKKLDSLSSWHFTPKAPVAEINIVTNAPTISMEDAQPFASSNNSQLAPQEIYSIKDKKNKTKGEVKFKSGLVMTKNEMSKEDKKRIRRSEKKKYNVNNDKPKSKKSEIHDVLKRGNVTIIDNKGEQRDTSGKLKKGKKSLSTSQIIM